jgi:DNA-binding transcriptional LysR family regulator
MDVSTRLAKERHMIELRQLNYFVAVAQTLHFGRAAERVHISQPALSVQIKALEQAVGVRLLARSKRSVSLTGAGALFLAEARLTLDLARHAEDVGRQAGRAALGRIEVGYGSSVPFTGVLPALIRSFGARHAGVELILNERCATEQSEALESGDLDFGVFHSGYAEERPGLQMAPLLRERYDVVLPSAHRLAARDIIGIVDLADEPFITCGQPHKVERPTPDIDLCRRNGFAPRVLQNVSHFTALVSLVAAGLGIGVVPHSLSQLHTADTVFRSLAVEDVSVLVCAYRRNERAPATLALIQAARRYAASGRAMVNAAA